MQPILVALIAVIGTLGGSLTTGLLQQKAIFRGEQTARAEKLREERIKAYSVLAESVVEMRRAQHQSWRAHTNHGPKSQEYQDLKDRYFQARSAARAALIRMQLFTNDDELVNSGQNAYNAAVDLEDFETAADRREGMDRARAATDEFVKAAARRAAFDEGDRSSRLS